MKALISIVKVRFKLLLQYRTAALAGVFTQFFFGMVMVMVLHGFYDGSLEEMPISYSSAISYIWLGQAMLAMLPWNGDGEIQNLIRSGNVSYELLRPMNLYNYWFARSIALRTAPTLLKSFMIFIIGSLLPLEYRMTLPTSFSSIFAWITTTFGALLISATITNLINISTLYSLSGDGIQRLLSSLVTLFSGMVVPLPLFPEAVKKIIDYLPFSGLLDIPARFFTGEIEFDLLAKYFIFQLVWAILLYGLGQWILKRKLSDLVVQGG